MPDVTEWMLDPEVAYLNHGAFGALPKPVAAAAAELRAQMEANPASLLARNLPKKLDHVRELVSALLGGDPAGAVFVPNATTGTATVIASLESSFSPGDELLTTDHRYGAVTAQFARSAEKYGTTPVVAHVPLDVKSADEVVAALVERITSRTRLLVVDSIASLSGFVFPVADIVAAAHERGVPVLVDAAHAPGQIHVDLARIGADFWVGNLHKWVCSPRAAAYLHIAPQWRDAVRPFVASHGFGKGFHDAFDWTGTFDPVNLLAVPAAFGFWSTQGGWDEVRRRQQEIVDDGAKRVAAAFDTTSPIDEQFRAAMRIIELPVQLDATAARQVETRLADEYRIEISLMPLHDKSWARVCGQVYNTPDDYDRLAAALPEVLQAEE
ncbi:MAG TPA: aminotransferase class V-fold PLP-dependent enzyme [Mycobacteriales bacterium]|nr:aminotransferase class V-fold PLP-dependent enzyme [Mycobacteriales bacterium]